jgi:beta-lactamase regulating signal transducer with metallopeptidase domain
MNTALWWLGQNTITVALLIPLVLVACRLCRNRPAVQHVLWLVVLLKFVTPPIVAWPWTAQEIQETLWPAPIASTEVADLPTEKPLSINHPEPDPVTPPVIDDRPPERKVAVEPVRPADVLPLERPAQETPVEQAEITPTPVAPVPDRGSLTEVVVRLTLGVWLGGAVVCLLCQVRRIARHAALVRRSLPAPEPLMAEIAITAKRLGIRPPRAVLAGGIPSPFMWCLGRLRLIWPEAMSSEAEIDRSRGVIAHELAHVRRGDHWLAWLELSAGIVWWWNPLFWFVRRRLRETAEMACDALAIGVNPESRREYAELLLELSAGFKTGAPAPVLAVSAGTLSSFERRFSMILSDRVSGKMSWWGLLAAMIFALMALPGWSLGQDRPSNVAKDPSYPTAKDRLYTPPTGAEPKPADHAAPAEKLEAAAIEAKIQKLEEEIIRLQQLLRERNATGAPPPNRIPTTGQPEDPRNALNEATAKKAKIEAEYQRMMELFKKGFVSKEQVDAARAALDQALASLKKLEANATDKKPGSPEYGYPSKTEPKPQNIAAWAQDREVKFFSLKYARAMDVSRILKDLFPEDEARNPRISADERSNSLIIRGTAKDRDAIEAIVERLEQSSADAIKKGESEKPRDPGATRPGRP